MNRDNNRVGTVGTVMGTVGSEMDKEMGSNQHASLYFKFSKNIPKKNPDQNGNVKCFRRNEERWCHPGIFIPKDWAIEIYP